MAKLWGGRFEQGTHVDVESFSNSLELDSRLLLADIEGSLAHAAMLGEQGIITLAEARALNEGLNCLREEFVAGKFEIPAECEDIHSALEQLLRAKSGEVAGKLHTARSRNDQVATACRLYLRGEVAELSREVWMLQTAFVNAAEPHLKTVLPGVTHMQHAQPVSLAHHLLAYFWMFQRDRERLRDLTPRLNTLPLGSGALAGTTLAIRRESTQLALGFTSLCENSLDAVSDRDFVVEFLSSASLIASHLSRLAEELILWTTPEFGFAKMSDEVTTGSSLMPQKKNPDVAELLRARTGRVTGALMGALTLLKGLPLSYNRDLQEDKFHLFTGLDSVRVSVRLAKLLLEKTEFQAERMARGCRGDQSNATDLADYLVKKGVPFRDTHEVAGKAVRLALSREVGLEDLSIAELRSLHPLFDGDVFAQLQPLTIMSTRNSRGGTGVEAVRQQIDFARKLLEEQWTR